MTINDIQNEIIYEFICFDDWMDKYAYIIEIGNSMPALAEQFKVPDNLIDGCQSRVWLTAEERDGALRFAADSDAIIVKGIVALLIRVVNDRTPDEILDANLFFIEEIGLKENLSHTRSNGLVAMVKQVRRYAVAYKAKLALS